MSPRRHWPMPSSTHTVSGPPQLGSHGTQKLELECETGIEYFTLLNGH